MRARIASPVGAHIYYRYARRAPTEAQEVDVHFNPVRARVAVVSGPVQINDVIAAWSDAPYEGTTGRIIGQVLDSSTGKGLPEIAISAGGLITFRDGEGKFRLDDLPIGLHNVALFSPNGAFRPWLDDGGDGAQAALARTVQHSVYNRPLRLLRRRRHRLNSH